MSKNESKRNLIFNSIIATLIGLIFKIIFDLLPIPRQPVHVVLEQPITPKSSYISETENLSKEEKYDMPSQKPRPEENRKIKQCFSAKLPIQWVAPKGYVITLFENLNSNYSPRIDPEPVKVFTPVGNYDYHVTTLLKRYDDAPVGWSKQLLISEDGKIFKSDWDWHYYDNSGECCIEFSLSQER